MWYVSSNRDESRYEDPHRFDLRRRAEHQAFGAGGRHFCLGTALARLELRILLEETLARFPEMGLAGTPAHAESPFANQSLPERLNAVSARATRDAPASARDRYAADRRTSRGAPVPRVVRRWRASGPGAPRRGGVAPTSG